MLIEIRIGPGKRKLSESISSVSRLCGTPLNKIHRIPHISLYGSFSADYTQTERVKEVMASVGKRYSYLPYLIDGFRWIQGKHGRVIYFNIVPSDGLVRFRHELAQRLLKIVPRTQSYDKDEDFIFHSTLAYKLDSREFESIWSYVSSDRILSGKFSSPRMEGENHNMRFFHLPLHALRVTFINEQSKIIGEYDFLQQRMLSRSEAMDSREWGRILKMFRLASGIEGETAGNSAKEIFLISDLHLGHANIIEHCARPFLPSNVTEMDDVLINNWNGTVGENEIYLLGDLSSPSGKAHHLQDKLKGKVHFIRGDNDTDSEDQQDYAIVKDGRYTFLLTHNPEKPPIPWNHWIIHGHKHNNDMKNYPFINGDRKTINVCPEVVNYRPVSLSYLSSLKLSSIRRMDTIDSIPVMR